MPDLSALAGEALAQAKDCDALLLDGTFWSDDEMRRAGVGDTTAGKMGHLPVGGPAGSLQIIRPLPAPRKIYLHINNTNPMLIEDSVEHQEVTSAGVEIGYDGMELTL
jgi:pyrroloquinoline quinone biosynthesis protein B